MVCARPGRGGAGEARRLQNPHSLFPEEKENAPFDGVREKGLGGGIPDFVRNARSACYGGFGLAIADGSDHSTTYAVSLVGGIQGYPLLLFSLPHPGCWGEIGGRGASGYSLLLFCCRSPVVAGGWRWGASGYPVLLFCCRSPVVAEDWKCRRNASANAGVRQRKEDGGASGRDPEFR